MKEECLLCGAPLEYLTRGRKMECALCHKKERSKTRCIKGHFICNQCHTKGIDQVLTLCLETTSANPVEILDHLMAQPFVICTAQSTTSWLAPACSPPTETLAVRSTWRRRW